MSYRAPGADLALLTIHGRVLVAIASEPAARVRELAAKTETTERSVQSAIADLCAAGYLTRIRDGRRNHYTVHYDAPLHHPGPGTHQVGKLLDLLANDEANPDDSREQTL